MEIVFRVGAAAPPAVPNLGEGFAPKPSDGIEIEILDGNDDRRVLPRAAVPGAATAGPLLIEDGTDTHVLPGWRAHTDDPPIS